LSRCHGTTPREPWAYGEETVKIFRKYAQLRYRLIPYLYAYAHIASQTGLPLMRPLLLEFQDDPAAHDVDSQYLLGEWLLIAPILTERDYRTIYLPRGRWMDYRTSIVYDGPKYIQYHAPLDTLPIFVREGAIIPLGPEMDFVGQKPFDRPLLVFRVGKVRISCKTIRNRSPQRASGMAAILRSMSAHHANPMRYRSGAFHHPCES
jgi:alpha-D-xyloside xylohydrolase